MLQNAQVELRVFVPWGASNIGGEDTILPLIELILHDRGVFDVVIRILQVLNVYVDDLVLRIGLFVIVPRVLESSRRMLLLLLLTLEVKRKLACSVVFRAIHSQVPVDIRFDNYAFIELLDHSDVDWVSILNENGCGGSLRFVPSLDGADTSLLDGAGIDLRKELIVCLAVEDCRIAHISRWLRVLLEVGV